MTVNTATKSSDKKARDVAYFSKIIRQHLPKLTQEYNISYLGIFGSTFVGNKKRIVISIFLYNSIKNLTSLNSSGSNRNFQRYSA